MVGHPEKHAGGQVGGGVARGLRRHRWKSQGRCRRRKRYVVGLGDDGEPAEGAGGVGGEPHVDALGVEAVAAAGQEPGLLAVLELGEAHGALHHHRVLLVVVRRAVVVVVVHRDRQRAQQLRVDAPAGGGPHRPTTTATTGRPGRPRTTAPPPACLFALLLGCFPVPGVDAALEGDDAQGEEDEEQEDARHGEDAPERHGARRPC